MLNTAERAYGVADPSEARLMTGRDFLQAMLDGRLPAPPIAKTLSFWLTEIGDGLAVFEGDAGPHLLNPLGIVHGGWALTLIDSAAGCAAHTLLPAGASYATIETKANFSRPISEGHGSRSRRRARDWPRAANHLLRGAGRRRQGPPSCAWDLDADGPGRRRACETCAGGRLAGAARRPRPVAGRFAEALCRATPRHGGARASHVTARANRIVCRDAHLNEKTIHAVGVVCSKNARPGRASFDPSADARIATGGHPR